MGVYTRKDSGWFYLYLETTRTKERTAIRIGTTTSQRQISRKLADALYHQRMTEIAARVHRLPFRHQSAVTFEVWVAWWQLHKLPHRKGRIRELEMLKTLLAGFRGAPLSTISQESVAEWITSRRQKVSARTVNREVDLLKTLLRDAVPAHLDVSPLVGMRRLAVVQPKRRLLTPADEELLLPKLKPDDRAIFLVGLDALVRLGDILDLRRDDDHGSTLYIRDPKDPTQSQPFEVPVSSRLRAALDALPASDSPYLFPRRRQAETEAGRRLVIRSALRDACRKAGLPYGRNGGIVFHWATRRTGATRMIQRGMDVKTVQAVGHWKNPDVVLKIYSETTTAAMRRAVESVSEPDKP